MVILTDTEKAFKNPTPLRALAFLKFPAKKKKQQDSISLNEKKAF